MCVFEYPYSRTPVCKCVCKFYYVCTNLYPGRSVLDRNSWHIYVHVLVYTDIWVSWHACVLTNDGTNILNICVSQNACVCTNCCSNKSLGTSVCVYICQKVF